MMRLHIFLLFLGLVFAGCVGGAGTGLSRDSPSGEPTSTTAVDLPPAKWVEVRFGLEEMYRMVSVELTASEDYGPVPNGSQVMAMALAYLVAEDGRVGTCAENACAGFASVGRGTGLGNQGVYVFAGGQRYGAESGHLDIEQDSSGESTRNSRAGLGGWWEVANLTGANRYGSPWVQVGLIFSKTDFLGDSVTVSVDLPPERFQIRHGMDAITVPVFPEDFEQLAGVSSFGLASTVDASYEFTAADGIGGSIFTFSPINFVGVDYSSLPEGGRFAYFDASVVAPNGSIQSARDGAVGIVSGGPWTLHIEAGAEAAQGRLPIASVTTVPHWPGWVPHRA